MDKVAVIYKSKYGSTKKYAGWIAIRLDADLYELGDIRNKDLKEYKTIIYGGGLYAGKINGIKFIKDNFSKIQDKKIIVFTVGIESEGEKLENKVKENNFTKEMTDKVKLVNFRGYLNYKELSIKDKLLMTGLKKYIKRKENYSLSEDEKIILNSFEKQIDFCDKKSISKILDVL